MSEFGDAYSDIAARAYENGWRSVRDLVYLIPDSVLEANYPWAFEIVEEDDKS